MYVCKCRAAKRGRLPRSNGSRLQAIGRGRARAIDMVDAGDRQFSTVKASAASGPRHSTNASAVRIVPPCATAMTSRSRSFRRRGQQHHDLPDLLEGTEHVAGISADAAMRQYTEGRHRGTGEAEGDCAARRTERRQGY